MTNPRKTRVQEFGYRVPRFPADFHLLLQTTDPVPRLLDARCKDISEDGLAAQVAESLSVGTRVILMLTLPGSSTSLRIDARVSHQRATEHGFAFICPSQNHRDKIQNYLSSIPTHTVRLPGSE